MSCAKNPPLPSVAPAPPQPLQRSLSWEVFVLLGQSCLCCCSVDMAPASAGQCPELGCSHRAAQELLGAQPQGSRGIGLRKGQVQLPKGRLCPLVSSGVLLPLHQRINNSHDFAATWQFAHDWEALQSNSVMVKHPNFGAIV